MPSTGSIALPARREALLGLLGLLFVPAALAQAGRRVPCIGFISNVMPLEDLRAGGHPNYMQGRVFVNGLRRLGWNDGENVRIEWRSAEGDFSRFPAIVRDLLQIPVDVLVGFGPGLGASLRQTRTVPVVSAALGFATAGGLRQQDRPNLTGVTMAVSNDVTGKRLSLLKTLLPDLRRVGMVFKPYGSSGADLDADDLAAAQALGVELVPVAVEYRSIANGLDAAIRHRVQALLIGSSPGFEQPRYREPINAWAHHYRIATMHSMPVADMGGCVLAYGTNLETLTARVPYFVDRILRGARPADLPMEQPAQYELVANVRAAKAIGLTIPPEIILQADRVIG